jgi:hypothetical protein
MFHSTGLASYQPLVEAAAEELCAELKPAAAAGKGGAGAAGAAGGSVDMHAALGNVALKAIGEAAFGWVLVPWRCLEVPCLIAACTMRLMGWRKKKVASTA